ncbi:MULTISPECIES: acyl carrier protein [Massilia]|uniref:Acyl carrier protein n=1 Tax=Massilia violaceinigra TaxID=2045208 RepID=A0A2D2DPA1_9BURK|nr:MULTISPECIES: acyl carrier protein [Massilia]ATQ76813.1 acyl carrier protein [Massilia violaceinigra]MDQ1812391.1 acyl carrier protein [Massilia sp. CCM 9210]MDQ1829166.1 acyl carrier protein [Massilia sp. CCM 9029]
MSKDRIYEIIVGHTREVVPSLDGHPFQQTDSLKSLGANSIDRADIIMMTLESLSVDIPLMLLAKADNIGDLARMIHEKS